MTCSQRMVAVKVRFAVTLPRSASSCDGRVRNPVIVCLQTLLAAWGIAATSSWPRLDPSAKLLRDQALSMTSNLHRLLGSSFAPVSCSHLVVSFSVAL
ncbi:hypothetical protein Bca4012_100897 [Brassica carinata]